MLKKMILLAMPVMAVAVVAAPAASATWTHEGVAITQNEEEGFHGTTEMINNEVGGVHCPAPETTVSIEMTAGTTDGHVELEVDTPTNCTVSGALAVLCGPHSLTDGHLASRATATIVTNAASQSVIEVSEVDFITEFGSCLTLRLMGKFKATPNNSGAINSVSLSGELTEITFGPFEVSGTLSATHSGAYGVDAV